MLTFAAVSTASRIISSDIILKNGYFRVILRNKNKQSSKLKKN